jgi:excisionase family DNA binding protein
MSHSTTESYAARRLPIPLLTVNEAAEYLNVERSSLYRLMRQGELAPSARVGKRWRFRLEDLDAYVERSREPAP